MNYTYDLALKAFHKMIVDQHIHIYSRMTLVDQLPKGYLGLIGVPYNDEVGDFEGSEDIPPLSDAFWPQTLEPQAHG